MIAEMRTPGGDAGSDDQRSLTKDEPHDAAGRAPSDIRMPISRVRWLTL